MAGNAGNGRIIQSVFRHTSQLPLLRPLAERNSRLLWLGESISVFGGTVRQYRSGLDYVTGDGVRAGFWYRVDGGGDTERRVYGVWRCDE